MLSLEPRRLLLCREGLARVCSEPFAALSSRSASRVDCHLTNYSINKYSPAFEHSHDPHEGATGTKRSLRPVLEQLAARGHDIAAIWSRIEHVVGAALGAMAGLLDGTQQARSLSLRAEQGTRTLLPFLAHARCPHITHDIAPPPTALSRVRRSRSTAWMRRNCGHPKRKTPPSGLT